MKEIYMEEALKEAKKSLEKDVPAIIVKNNKIIARGYNKKEKKHSAIKHAEIVAIDKACKKLKSWHLEECEIYITMEPCLMCLGAIVQARIPTIYYGVKNDKFGMCKYFNSDKKIKINNHYMDFYGGYLEEDIKKMLKKFFCEKR